MTIFSLLVSCNRRFVSSFQLTTNAEGIFNAVVNSFVRMRPPILRWFTCTIAVAASLTKSLIMALLSLVQASMLVLFELGHSVSGLTLVRSPTLSCQKAWSSGSLLPSLVGLLLSCLRKERGSEL